ncbi:hypothetical protein GGR28_003350 [Lewinella aquimaris]|uniref:Septum formation inhibitor Maf n=1 Tax=Neolewinella aquimaris TaxID=1835722 RepID=A0A840EAZ2_9BACT|nr:hypothetical protein [Neolewinella aquimaris]MBB4080715.1 hypothetical protein [Neolewinella aquimaris]
MNCLPALAALALLFGCNARPSPDSSAPASPPSVFSGELPPYWYQSTAEISTYDLQQARYGEMRDGEAILIQVSEDFLTDRQVKNDNYENPNSAPVLKTNLFRRFNTGIYDYSLMTSVFTPTNAVEHPRTLKVTTSSQDWCGQSYTQLNYAGGEQWEMQLRSYFEREGDQEIDLSADFLEDEVFNRIRIGGNPPEGEFEVIPNTGYLLMTHQPYVAAEATASVEEAGAGRRTYVLDYTGLDRRLTVTFDTASPYIIREWTETYPSRDTVLTTTATLREQKLEPYWQLNGTKDAPLRAELGLD